MGSAVTNGPRRFGGIAGSVFQCLLDVLLPPLCGLCRGASPTEGTPFCAACRGRLTCLEEPFCTSCGLPFLGAGPSHPCGRCASAPPPFREIRAWGLYRGGLLEAIHRFKYGREVQLRSALEALALQALDRFWAPSGFSAVVPVPCHAATLRSRGFDLPALLSRRLSRERAIPWRPRALWKARRSPDLVGLGLRERARAVAGAYEPREPLTGPVLLVDDVATSASTARACATACREAGATEVTVLVLARTPL